MRWPCRITNQELYHKHGRMVEVPPKLRDRIVAANILIEQAYGKPPLEIKAEDETPSPTGEETMARIMELLPRVLPFLPVDREEIGRMLAEQRQIEVLVSGQQVKDDRSGNGDGA